MSLLQLPCGRCGAHSLRLAKWGVAKEAVGWAVDVELTPDTMIPLMLQSEEVWKYSVPFISLVMRTKDPDGRRSGCRAGVE